MHTVHSLINYEYIWMHFLGIIVSTMFNFAKETKLFPIKITSIRGHILVVTNVTQNVKWDLRRKDFPTDLFCISMARLLLSKIFCFILLRVLLKLCWLFFFFIFGVVYLLVYSYIFKMLFVVQSVRERLKVAVCSLPWWNKEQPSSRRLYVLKSGIAKHCEKMGWGNIALLRIRRRSV